MVNLLAERIQAVNDARTTWLLRAEVMRTENQPATAAWRWEDPKEGGKTARQAERGQAERSQAEKAEASIGRCKPSPVSMTLALEPAAQYLSAPAPVPVSPIWDVDTLPSGTLALPGYHFHTPAHPPHPVSFFKKIYF